MGIERIPQDSSGYFVYAMLCQDGDGPGYVKFGHSGSITTRLQSLRVGCPIPARFFAFSHIGQNKKTTRRVEKALHSRFKGRKVSGEWFRFDFKSEDDKREFNDGCREAFQSILGGKHEWWTKSSVAALDAYAKERQNQFLKSPHKNKMLRQQDRERAANRSRRELDSYRGAA